MATVEERVSRLTDQQALSIVDSLAGEFAGSDTPEGQKAQAQALGALFSQEGHAVDLSRAADCSTAAAAGAARQLLLLMAQLPQIRLSLEQWLDNPPFQEAAALPLLLAAPVVFTGCIALLQIAGHVVFNFDSEKKHWSVSYDPTRPTPFDEPLNKLVGSLASLMGKMAPGV